MHYSKLRRQLAWHAARLLFSKQESDWFRARARAVRELVRGWVPPADMPQRDDIHEQLQRMMRQCPPAEISLGESAVPSAALAPELMERDDDCWSLFASLLYPLENVRLPRREHPEGDALYHSLQVFALVREQQPYDEELLLAALLHAVGEPLDRVDPVGAGIAALGDSISDRTRWLIEQLDRAEGLLDGTIGARARRRLSQHESFGELQLLARCDRAGRQRGAQTPTVAEALEYLRDLRAQCDDDGDAYDHSW